MKPPVDAKHIQAAILDVDGVLTDGRIGYGLGCDDEIKFFDVRDGHGIRMLLDAGLRVGILSGRCSKANRRRAEELRLSFLFEGESDKVRALNDILQQEGLSACQCLYMGDDLVDLGVLKEVGLAVAPSNAVAEVKSSVHKVCLHAGGRGAVREMAEWLLREKGLWQSVVAQYVH